MLIKILCNKLLLGRATSQLASCTEPSRAGSLFHEPQKQARLGLVLSVEPVRAEPSRCEPELARRARAFFPALSRLVGSLAPPGCSTVRSIGLVGRHHETFMPSLGARFSGTQQQPLSLYVTP
jgi:hypothetical protein